MFGFSQRAQPDTQSLCWLHCSLHPPAPLPPPFLTSPQDATAVSLPAVMDLPALSSLRPTSTASKRDETHTQHHQQQQVDEVDDVLAAADQLVAAAARDAAAAAVALQPIRVRVVADCPGLRAARLTRLSDVQAGRPAA